MLEGMTRPRKDVEAVRDLLDQDLPIAEVARRVGIARATVRDWATKGFDDVLDGRRDDSGVSVQCGFAGSSGISLKLRTRIFLASTSATVASRSIDAGSTSFGSFRTTSTPG